MKVIFMCGSHPRHLYIANKLYENGYLEALVMEEREDFVPQPPEGLIERDRNNFIKHFAERDLAEKKYFQGISYDELLNNVDILHTDWESLNSPATISFIKKHSADFLFSYGIHKVSDEIIDCYEERSFNIHGGLSPWYKGNTTLFWPFYFLKPNWAGMTIHRLTKRLDGGDILHHSVPELSKGDKMHEVACKAVIQVAEDLCTILKLVQEGGEIHCEKQKGNGKLFLSKDWSPQTLRVIYELFDDKIVDAYLGGELTSENPPLVRAF